MSALKRGERGDQGIQGPNGPQGVAGVGERGPQGDNGERGAQGKDGSRTKLPHRVFLAFLLIVIVSASSGYVAYNNYQQVRENYRDVQEGRRVGLNVVCAFGSALAEAGRVVLNASARPKGERARRFERELEALGYPPRAERAGAGQAYVNSIASRVEFSTGIKGLVIRKGPQAGTLDCAALKRAAIE